MALQSKRTLCPNTAQVKIRGENNLLLRGKQEVIAYLSMSCRTESAVVSNGTGFVNLILN